MNWPKQKIVSFARVGAGQAAPQRADEFGEIGHPFVRAGSLESLCAGAAEDSLEKIPDSVAQKRGMNLYPAGTILFAKSGMSATLGRVYKLKIPSYVVSHLATINTQAGADANFLAHYFRFSSPAQLINDGAYPSIRLADISEWEIPFPPLDEQKRIASILDKADALRRQRQESLQLTETLLESIFFDKFGDPVINPKGFPVRTLGDFFSSPAEGAKCGPFGSALKKSDSQQFGVPVWGIDNISIDGCFVDTAYTRISAEKFEELRSYGAQNGDILISRAGTVGKMCVVNTKETNSIIGSNLIRLRLNSDLLSPHWFVAFMKYCKGRVARLRAGPDGAFTHMSTKILQGLEFPYPSPNLQKEFLNICQAVGIVNEPAKASAYDLNRLLSSLQQRAFRGELDLSKVKLESAESAPPEVVVKKAETVDGIFHRPGYFPTPPELEADMMELEDKLSYGPGDSIPWNENYFKYRILSQVLRAPFAFQEIWDQVQYDMPDTDYETVKDKLFEYVQQGLLEQRFDGNEKGIVFWPPL
jgi:type I restriction enzyme S subunit